MPDPTHSPRTVVLADLFPTEADARKMVGGPDLGRYIGVWLAPDGLYERGVGPWHVFTDEPNYWMAGWTIVPYGDLPSVTMRDGCQPTGRTGVSARISYRSDTTVRPSDTPSDTRSDGPFTPDLQ